jgi:hypothetical protein
VVYTVCVLRVSDEQRQYLKLDGAPLPLVNDDDAACYMLMPVRFTRDASGSVLARVPGIPACGEGDQPIEALATLAVLIQINLERL